MQRCFEVEAAVAGPRCYMMTNSRWFVRWSFAAPAVPTSPSWFSLESELCCLVAGGRVWRGPSRISTRPLQYGLSWRSPTTKSGSFAQGLGMTMRPLGEEWWRWRLRAVSARPSMEWCACGFLCVPPSDSDGFHPVLQNELGNLVFARFFSINWATLFFLMNAGWLSFWKKKHVYVRVLW